MGALLPNPPIEPNAFAVGTQLLFAYATQNVTTASPIVAPAAGNARPITAAGTQLAGPVFSTLNGVTRIFREVRQSGAAANVNCGWSVTNTFGVGACMFPGANGDGGFRTRLWCGTDSVVGAIASTRMLCGITGGSTATPAAAVPLTNAAANWFGVYNLGAGGGLRFGFKIAGGAITNLDVGGELTPLWAAYQGWAVDIFCSPNGPRTFYSVGRLNAAATAYEPLLVGSTVLYNPGRVCFGPTFVAMPSAAGQNTDIYLCNATQTAYPFGTLSL